MINDEKFLQFIFNGCAACFHKAFWHTSSSYSDMTTADLNFFLTLGQHLGFRVRREMNYAYPRDLCWCESNEITSDADAKTLLYLERENKDDRADYTINKMLDPNNAPSVPYLVALFGWIKPSTLANIKTEIQKKLQERLHQSFLLISWVGETQNGDDWRLEGWCFSGQKTTTRTLEVQLDDNKHWYIVTDPNKIWA